MKEKNKIDREKYEADAATHLNEPYTRAIVFRGTETDIFSVDDFLSENNIKFIYRKTALVPLYITAKKEEVE